MPGRIVVPGELITEERKLRGSHTHIQGGKIYSDCLGLSREGNDKVSVIPLQGKYMPYMNDVIIGVIVDERMAVYIVDINSYYNAVIPKRLLRDPLRVGSTICAKIISVNEVNEADLTGIREFFGGEIFLVSPVKVPRIIGRNNSMLEVLRKGTGSTIMVGRNGRVWAKDGNIELLVEALDKIQRESHTEHLTSRMEEFFGGKLKGGARKDMLKPELKKGSEAKK